MNIFVLDDEAHRAARYHCNKHVVKMIIESCQLLSNVHHFHNPGNSLDIYKSFGKGHAAHPCAVWARASGGNYEWLYDLACALAVEFALRYGKGHRSAELLEGALRILPGALIESRPLRTPFAQCMPEEYRHADPVVAYRTYYVAEKMGFAKWTGRQPPLWIEEMRYRAETLKGERLAAIELVETRDTA